MDLWQQDSTLVVLQLQGLPFTRMVLVVVPVFRYVILNWILVKLDSRSSQFMTCMQIRCKDETICTKRGSTIVVTDLNRDSKTDLVLSRKAFKGMAKQGMEQDVLKLGIAEVEYKRLVASFVLFPLYLKEIPFPDKIICMHGWDRIPCDYKNKKVSIRVEESSQKRYYLAIKLLYVGGQTEIVGVDVAQVGSSNWQSMSRNYGAVWDTSRVPKGALQFRFVVTAGYDGKWYWAKQVLPGDWENGVVYESGIQVTDIAQEGCSPCDDGSGWN